VKKKKKLYDKTAQGTYWIQSWKHSLLIYKREREEGLEMNTPG